MTDLDLDRLGDVWREQPDPAEMERLQRVAANVSRRARFAQIVDVGAAVVVAGVVILLVISNPSSRTVVMGTAAIVILLISNVRLRRVRQLELRSLTGSTEDMLDQSIDRVETTLRNHRFSLIAIGPAFVLGWLFMNVVADPSLRERMPITFDAPVFRLVWAGAWIAALAGLMLFIWFAIRRGRRELERLRAMRESYRQEQRSSDA